MSPLLQLWTQLPASNEEEHQPSTLEGNHPRFCGKKGSLQCQNLGDHDYPCVDQGQIVHLQGEPLELVTTTRLVTLLAEFQFQIRQATTFTASKPNQSVLTANKPVSAWLAPQFTSNYGSNNWVNPIPYMSTNFVQERNWRSTITLTEKKGVGEDGDDAKQLVSAEILQGVNRSPKKKGAGDEIYVKQLVSSSKFHPTIFQHPR